MLTRTSRIPAGQPTDTVLARDALLAEYSQLKTEQHTRISTRDNLLYAVIAATAAVLAAARTGHSPAYLLLIPPVSLILGWTYLANDEMITAIGRYLRDELAPRLTGLAGAGVPLLAWEAGWRHDPFWRSRKTGQLIVDLAAFAVPPAAAVTAYLLRTPKPGQGLLAIAVVELAAAAGYAVRVINCAELPRTVNSKGSLS